MTDEPFAIKPKIWDNPSDGAEFAFTPEEEEEFDAGVAVIARGLSPNDEDDNTDLRAVKVIDRHTNRPTALLVSYNKETDQEIILGVLFIDSDIDLLSLYKLPPSMDVIR